MLLFDCKKKKAHESNREPSENSYRNSDLSFGPLAHVWRIATHPHSHGHVECRAGCGVAAVRLEGDRHLDSKLRLQHVENVEHGMGFEPMYNGFAGRRVSHFATRAHPWGPPVSGKPTKNKTHCTLAVGSTNLKIVD